MHPFADRASMRIVQLVGGINVVQRENREKEKIDEKKADPDGKRSRPGFRV